MTIRVACKSEDVDFFGMLYYTLNLFHTAFDYCFWLLHTSLYNGSTDEKDDNFNDLKKYSLGKKSFMGNHI